MRQYSSFYILLGLLLASSTTIDASGIKTTPKPIFPRQIIRTLYHQKTPKYEPKHTLRLSTTVSQNVFRPFESYYNQDSEERAHLKINIIRALRSIFSVSNSDSRETKYTAHEQFSRFLDFYSTTPIASNIADFFRKEVGLSPLQFTQTMNLFANYQAFSLSSISGYTNIVNQFSRLIVPDLITLELFRVLLNSLMFDISEKREPKKAPAILCKQFLERVMKGKVTLPQLIGSKKRKPPINRQNHLELTTSPLFKTNLYFFISEIEFDIYGYGTFHNVQYYLDHQKKTPIYSSLVNSIMVKEDRMMGVLVQIWRNYFLTPRNKAALMIRIIDEVDQRLPCFYFVRDCKEGKSEYFHILETFIFDSYPGNVKIKNKWRDFKETIMKNGEESIAYARQQLFKQQAAYLTLDNPFEAEKCSSTEFMDLAARLFNHKKSKKEEILENDVGREEKGRTVEDDTKIDKDKLAFCMLIQSCTDLSLLVKGVFSLFHLAADHCKSNDITKAAIENAIARYQYSPHRDSKEFALFMKVIRFCFSHSISNGALLSTCELIMEFLNSKGHRTNILNIPGGEQLIEDFGVENIIKLGLSERLLILATNHTHAIEHFNSKIEMVLYNPELLSAVLSAIQHNRSIFLYRIFILLNTAENDEIFEERYYYLTTAIFKYYRDTMREKPTGYHSRFMDRFMSDLAPYRPDLPYSEEEWDNILANTFDREWDLNLPDTKKEQKEEYLKSLEDEDTWNSVDSNDGIGYIEGSYDTTGAE